MRLTFTKSPCGEIQHAVFKDIFITRESLIPLKSNSVSALLTFRNKMIKYISNTLVKMSFSSLHWSLLITSVLFLYTGVYLVYASPFGTSHLYPLLLGPFYCYKLARLYFVQAVYSDQLLCAVHYTHYILLR